MINRNGLLYNDLDTGYQDSESYTFDDIFNELGNPSIRNAVDVGAYVGKWTQYLSTKVTGTVYSYEPISYNFECLVENTKNLTNVNASQICILNKFNRDSKNFNSRILDDNVYLEALVENNFNTFRGKFTDDGVLEPNTIGKYNNEELVTAKELDELDLIDVDFINIHINGAEILAIKGASNLIEQFKPIILFSHVPDKMRNYFQIDGIHTNLIENDLFALDYQLVDLQTTDFVKIARPIDIS